MFTGLVQEIGSVSRLKKIGGGIQLSISAPQSSSELHVNDSVAINGCCQTVVSKTSTEFSVEAVEETLKKTTLGEFTERLAVNIELAMKMSDRLGGHLVLGHVDGVGTVTSRVKAENSWLFNIRIPKDFLPYVVQVGSIAIDGVSLTVAHIQEQEITVSIIPHTFENTTFHFLALGKNVNLEFDIIGKYIERLMAKKQGDDKSAITRGKLKEWGYPI